MSLCKIPCQKNLATPNKNSGNNSRSCTAVKNPIKQDDEDFARIRSRRFQIERKSQGLTPPTWARSERCWDVLGRAAGRLSAVYSTGRGSSCARRMRTGNCLRWLRQWRGDGGEQSARGALCAVLEFGKRAACPPT